MNNLLFLSIAFVTTFAQSPLNWTWISGSNLSNQPGNYGTKGIASPSNLPRPRSYSTAWTDSDNNIWLFGGKGFNATGSDEWLNDLWKFDGTNWIWISGSNVSNQWANYGTKGVASSSNVPGSRHSAVSWEGSDNNLWLFGGYGFASLLYQAYLNDLWKFDGVNWTWISGSNTSTEYGNYGIKGVASSSNIPGGRELAVTWKDSNDNLWLFGGFGYVTNSDWGYLNDLWKFDGVNWVWISGSNSANQNGNYGIKGVASSSNVPGGREIVASWIDSNDDLWIFGGFGYDSTLYYGYLNDLWKFDGVNWIWISGSNITNQNGNYGTKGVASPSNTPGSRYSTISWTDSNDNFWLFGEYGYAATGNRDNLNDLWKYDGMNWIWISGSNSVNQRANYGTKGIPSSSNIPGAREDSVSCIDSNDNLWLFGGHGYDTRYDWGSLNDLWKFELIAPSPATSSASTSTTGDNVTSGTSTIRTTSIILIIVGILVIV